MVTKTQLLITPGSAVSVDLNKDGVPEVGFSLFNYQDFGPSFRATLNVSAFAGGGVAALPGPYSRQYASAFARGAKIGPSAHFAGAANGPIIERSFGNINSSRHSTTQRFDGNWGHDGQVRFLGVKFLINGQTHYGWVRMSVTSSSRAFSLRGAITAYAYETVANKPILAGNVWKATAEVQIPVDIEKQEAPSLGMLALGADALALWRQEESSSLN